MRDAGLDEAIRAAGGVGALARKIGISQPSVSNWSRIPAERVLSVEAATGREPRDPAARSLRREPASDRMRTRSTSARAAGIRAARRAARARARVAIARSPCRPARRRHLRSGWRMPRSPRRRAAPMRERVEREFFDLFIGLGRGELLPYGSYYLTGFLHERPLARLREDLGAARHRARRRSGRAGRSRRHPVRDHGRPGRAAASATGAAPIASSSKASGALDRPLLRRPGAGRGRRLLSPRRRARPGVHGDRDRSLRAAGVSGATRNDAIQRTEDARR